MITHLYRQITLHGERYSIELHFYSAGRYTETLRYKIEVFAEDGETVGVRYFLREDWREFKEMAIELMDGYKTSDFVGYRKCVEYSFDKDGEI